MFTVIGKQNLNLTIKRLDIRTDNLVGKLRPGQFIAVMADRYARRIPFSVFEVDWRRKCLSIIIEETDAETKKLGALKINDEVFSVSGPYGLPCPIEKKGAVLCVGEGLGLSSLVPLCRAFKQVGNKVLGIAGFETRKSSILENQMRLNCHKFYVMYKDGMHDRKGDVLAPLKKALGDEPVAQIYADASVRTLEDIASIAAENRVPLVVNLMALVLARPVFFDTGHVFLNGKTYFPAVDGILVDAAGIDLKDIARSLDSAKEYSECRKKEAASWNQPNVFARFKKFIWG